MEALKEAEKKIESLAETKESEVTNKRKEAAQIYAQVLRDGSYGHGRDININHNNYNNRDW